MKKIAVFASGNGSNAQNICEYFQGSTCVEVSLILTNNKDAYVLERAKSLSVPSFVFSIKQLKESDVVINKLIEEKIDFIVLAGFMVLVPLSILKNYKNKIINIHPALLPKFGGKGMYGSNVHDAVIAAAEKESGITIHFVNEKYDEGEMIFQANCPITPHDTPNSLAKKIHTLEYNHYPKVIEEVVNSWHSKF